jgi:hypothetical protein
MKRIFLTAAAMTAIIAITAISCQQPATDANAAQSTATAEDPVKRGEYLVNTIGCDDCHTPKKMGPRGPEPDMEFRFAGHLANQPIGPVDTSVLSKGWLLFGPSLTVAVGPWGVSYAANISGDSTGIGNWTEEQFFRAMREGKYKGLENSRPMLPPMPWQNFAKLKDDDLRAMFLFLKSTKPINNVVPAPKPLNAL